jgi:hypothetical protein
MRMTAAERVERARIAALTRYAKGSANPADHERRAALARARYKALQAARLQAEAQATANEAVALAAAAVTL